MKLSNKGLTLIEVIASIAILGVVAISFIGLFSDSWLAVFSVGNREEAMSDISNLLEMLYSEQPKDGFDNKSSILGKLESSIKQAFGENTDVEEFVTIIPVSSTGPETTVIGFDVTITFPFRSRTGESQVALNAFFRGE